MIANSLQAEVDALNIPLDIIARHKNESLFAFSKRLGLDRQMIARVVVLGAGDYRCLVVVPLNALIDFRELKALSQHDLQFVPEHQLEGVFHDCAPHSLPPFGDLYDLETYCDDSLLSAHTVLFEAGDASSLVRLSVHEFKRLMKNTVTGRIARHFDELTLPAMDMEKLTSAQKIDALTQAMDGLALQSVLPITSANAVDLAQEDCPPLPGLAAMMLNEQAEQVQNFRALKELLGDYPELYQHIMQVVSSPLFSRFAPLDDDNPEETLLTGSLYTLVLGLLILNGFRFTTSGSLSFAQVYQHALYSTALALRLTQELNESGIIKQSQLVLAGLLQNVGLLYYATEHADRYFILNKLVAANLELDMTMLESVLNQGQGLGGVQTSDDKALHYHHAMLGGALVQEWQLPKEVLYSVLYHHDNSFKLDFFQYPNLLLIANCLLLEERESPVACCRLSKAIFERLRIRPEICKHTAVRFLNECAKLKGDLFRGTQFEVLF